MLEALILVELVLVSLLDLRTRKIEAKQLDEFFVGLRNEKWTCTPPSGERSTVIEPPVRSASSWNVLLVVRPQPGHAVTLGANDRSPSACSSSQHA